MVRIAHHVLVAVVEVLARPGLVLLAWLLGFLVALPLVAAINAALTLRANASRLAPEDRRLVATLMAQSDSAAGELNNVRSQLQAQKKKETEGLAALREITGN